MPIRWKLVILGMLAFQWILVLALWDYLNVVSGMAGMELRKTAWGADGMWKVWIGGGVLIAGAFATVCVDIMRAPAPKPPEG